MQLGLLVFIFSLGTLPINSQVISGEILALDSHNPIPYATIQYGDNQGVISNAEGLFSIYTTSSIDSLVITSLGYETVYLKDFGKEMEILLTPQTTELREVYLSDEVLSGKEIMDRVVANIDNNYDFGFAKRSFFYRQSSNQKIDLDLDIKKSSIDEINQILMDDITSNIPKEVGSYVEVAGDLYGNYDQQKLSIEKAANLYNTPVNENLDKLTQEFENILRENIKEDSFLRIRTGLLGVKIDSEDLSESLNAMDTQQTLDPAEKEKRALKSREQFQVNTQERVSNLFNRLFWKDDLEMDFFDRSRRYNFTIEGFKNIEGHGVYVIDIAPKRRGDFKGKIYVNIEDYGVHRLEFENVDILSRFKLFGISKTVDLNSSKMFFSRSDQGKYALDYLEYQTGETIGIDRPLKIIERNRVVPGRNKQNQLKMNIDMGVRDITTYQFYVFQSEPINRESYDNLEISKDYELENFEAYNSEYWEGTTIIEPNTAIKEYTTMQPVDL